MLFRNRKIYLSKTFVLSPPSQCKYTRKVWESHFPLFLSSPARRREVGVSLLLGIFSPIGGKEANFSRSSDGLQLVVSDVLTLVASKIIFGKKFVAKLMGRLRPWPSCCFLRGDLRNVRLEGRLKKKKVVCTDHCLCYSWMAFWFLCGNTFK